MKRLIGISLFLLALASGFFGVQACRNKNSQNTEAPSIDQQLQKAVDHLENIDRNTSRTADNTDEIKSDVREIKGKMCPCSAVKPARTQTTTLKKPGRQKAPQKPTVKPKAEVTPSIHRQPPPPPEPTEPPQPLELSSSTLPTTNGPITLPQNRWARWKNFVKTRNWCNCTDHDAPDWDDAPKPKKH